MRKFNPYELNQLLKFGFDPDKVALESDLDIPIEYITGKVEFRGNIFLVDKNTLIPRIETEKLVDIATNFIAEKELNRVEFIDVGTGSGAIGISFIKELIKRGKNFNAKLTDISIKTLTVCRQNLELIYKEDIAKQIKSRNYRNNRYVYAYSLKSGKYITNIVEIFKSDLLKNLKYDKLNIIFANLPYIPTARINQLDNSVKNFEPISALDGEEDGLKYIRELLKQAPSYLAKDGIILLEVDDTHTDASEFKDKYDIEIKNDENGKNRFWICRIRD